MNKGFLKAHSIEWISPFKLAPQLMPLPIYQNNASPLPEPIKINLSFNSNQDKSNTASYVINYFTF